MNISPHHALSIICVVVYIYIFSKTACSSFPCPLFEIAQGLLGLSGAHVVTNTAIARISLDDKSGYLIESSEKESSHFDHVVLAFPLETGNIIFSDSIALPRIHPRTVHVTHTTFFTARGLNASALCMACQTPSVIITTESNLDFSSIGAVGVVNEKEAQDYLGKGGFGNGKASYDVSLPILVYKVFSRQPLSDEWIFTHFIEVNASAIHRIPWKAYPLLSPSPLPPFVLGQGLYYVNAIESAASAMELSVIAAQNVAMLIEKSERTRTVVAKENRSERQKSKADGKTRERGFVQEEEEEEEGGEVDQSRGKMPEFKVEEIDAGDDKMFEGAEHEVVQSQKIDDEVDERLESGGGEGALAEEHADHAEL